MNFVRNLVVALVVLVLLSHGLGGTIIGTAASSVYNLVLSFISPIVPIVIVVIAIAWVLCSIF